MAEVTSNHESYDFPNFVGDLFLSGEGQRSFLRLIGTVDQYEDAPSARAPRTVRSNFFTVSNTYDLDAASQPSIDEGEDPSFDEHTISNEFNAVQIFQEGVQVSYSAQSNDEQVDEWGSSGVAGLGDVAVPNQLEWQVDRKIEQIVRDMNFSFLQGTFAQGSAGVARQTRGLDNAISTNVDTAGSNRDLTKAIFEGAIKDAAKSGLDVGGRMVAIGDLDQFDNLINIYEQDAVAPESVNVAGVEITRLRTKYGTVEVAADVDMPANTLFVLDPRMIRATAREIPERGLLFAEPVARTGAALKWQVYGEWGLDYGDEARHLKVDSLNA